MKTINILGVKINDLTMAEAVDYTINLLRKKGHHYIVTPNPEFLVAAYYDRDFKQILNKADLSIPDGIGLKITGKIKNRLAGTDFMEKLCEVASKKTITVGLLGSSNKAAEKAAECLREKYAKLKVTIASGGIRVNNQGETQSGLKNIPQTDILFVGLGHLKQEKWIAKNLNKNPVKIMVGVGGAFDYISVSIPRAPKLVRELGFEWLFRLLMQPWRIKRQLKLFQFIWLLLTD